MAKRVRTGPTLVQRSRRVSPGLKAFFHQKSGAGSSRVRRPFIGLSAADAEQVGEALTRAIQARLDRGQA